MKVQSVGLYNSIGQNSIKPANNAALSNNANFELPNYKQTQYLKPVTFKGVNKKQLNYLIDKNILPKTANKDLSLKGDLNPDIKADIRKMREAEEEGISLAEAFVPSFYDDTNAVSSLKVGDTYKIVGDNYIEIVGKGRKPVKLALTREKYLELFPPAKRFSTAQSSGIGNCWFLSALDSMYSNPNTRSKVLSIFKEDRAGNVLINFGGYNVEGFYASEKKKNEPSISETETKKPYQMNCPKGFAMIENAYETRCRYLAKLNIADKFHEFFNHKYDRIPRINGQRYTRDEIRSFLGAVGSDINDMNELSKKFIDPKIKSESFYLSRKDVRKYYDYLNSDEARVKYSKKEIIQLKRVLLRNYEYMKRKGKQEIEINEIIPAKLYFDFTFEDKKDIERFSGFPYSCGGYAQDAFTLLGMRSDAFLTKENERKLKHLLSTDNINSKYVITAGINEGHEVKKIGFTLDDKHEYSIKPLHKNGERIFLVKNPHNASHSIPMNKKELLKYFDEITFARIEE